jgi:hypothetical protein
VRSSLAHQFARWHHGLPSLISALDSPQLAQYLPASQNQEVDFLETRLRVSLFSQLYNHKILLMLITFSNGLMLEVL